MLALFNGEKRIGSQRKRRKYDLPLNKSAGTGFLLLLIALMTFLALLTITSSFVLSAMANRWTSGLENKVTIEIPAEDSSGTLMSSEQIKNVTFKIHKILLKDPYVQEASVMSQQEIRELVEPWLGKGLLLSDVPLPGLISVELKDSSPKLIKTLEDKIQTINTKARIDTHQQWLNDLLKFTSALKFATLCLTIIIGFTTITAVAGAVKSRLEVYHEEVELLHLMGAQDHYISRQFQKHSLLIALKGSSIGMFFGIIILFFINWISGEADVNLLPDFTLTTVHLVIIGLLPLALAMISTLTTRQTVLKVLSTMP